MRSWPGWQWQYTRAVRSRVPCRGKISPRCVPGRLPMAKCSRNAFPGGNPWQVLRSMHPESGLGRENRQFAARFARHASEMSWLWQDMRAMHPKSPANRLSGTHGVKILPGRGTFRCTGPSNHARCANVAIRRRRSALAPAIPVPPTSAKPPERPQPQRRRTARNSTSRPQPRRRPHGSAPPTAFAVPAAATPQTLPHPTAPRH